MRSDMAPKKIFNRLVVVSATPSINPITAVRTPRMLARKKGMRFNNISEEMSLSSDVADITHTLRGNLRQPFVISPHLKVKMAVQLRSIPVGLPFYLQRHSS